jgi:flagellar hook-length control protein FliK
MVDQRMNLLIRTETPEAHAALGARVNGLREALAQHGVVIERLEMPLPPPAHPDALPPPDQDGSQPQPDGSAMHSGDDNGSRTAQHESRENDDWPPALSVADDAEAVGDLRLDIRV